MPRPGFLWRHVIINTKNTWLHGDERGFRSRNRAIRSSGDYKHRPPPEEYRKLREYFEKTALAPKFTSSDTCARSSVGQSRVTSAPFVTVSFPSRSERSMRTPWSNCRKRGRS